MSWAGAVELDSEAAGTKGQESEERGKHVDYFTCELFTVGRCVMARVWWSDAVLYYTLTIYTVRGTLVAMLFGLKRGYAPCIMVG
jgi:hypothetical protein